MCQSEKHQHIRADMVKPNNNNYSGTIKIGNRITGFLIVCNTDVMHSSAKLQSPPLSVVSLSSRDKVYHK